MDTEVFDPIKDTINHLASQALLFVVLTGAVGIFTLLALKFLRVPTKLAAGVAQLVTLVAAYPIFMKLFS